MVGPVQFPVFLVSLFNDLINGGKTSCLYMNHQDSDKTYLMSMNMSSGVKTTKQNAMPGRFSLFLS